MTLRNRYRRLNLWNKLGAWGSLASLVGLIGIPFAIYSLFFQPAPRLHVTLEDVLDKLKAHDASFERDPLVARTFWLLREPGASIALGRCPGPECFQFILGPLRTVGGSLIQQIFLSGEGFSVRRNPEPKLLLHMDNKIEFNGCGVGLNNDKMWMDLALAKGNSCGMSTVQADISLKVLDTRSDSLRIHLEVRHGTYKSPQQQRGRPPQTSP